jgi:hypothetical protein
MSDNRLTARFSDQEIRNIEAHALALGMSKTEVLRRGVHSLLNADRFTDRLAEIREQLGEDMRAEMTVMNAPEGTKQALDEIFKD